MWNSSLGPHMFDGDDSEVLGVALSEQIPWNKDHVLFYTLLLLSLWDSNREK